ncbi:MAG: T9SS type A sorting domain-containing protein [Bacteroidia bacterium]
MELDLSSYSSGIYVIQVINSDGRVSRKLVKE